jgi:hypothetical protein
MLAPDKEGQMTSPSAWRGIGKPRANKYRAKPVTIDGVFFASTKEARRWAELQLMQRAGYIADLKRQVRFALDVNGVPICHYVADATYTRLGKLVIEDTKGMATDVYRLKKKLMKACLGLEIEEV